MAGPRKLRLLHTSDIHIGDEVYPLLRRAGLTAAVDAAIATAVDAVLIAGDLFDSARVSDQDIAATWAELARLPVPIVLLPGNHDCLGAPTIYSRTSPGVAGDHVHFLANPDGEYLRLDDLGLTVWGRGMVEHYPANLPLQGYQRPEDGNWQVVMAHGHYVRDGEETFRSSPIAQHQIGSLRCDYLALGHWHQFADVSAGDTRASYCGAPAEPGVQSPTANLVVLDPTEGVRIERIPLTDG